MLVYFCWDISRDLLSFVKDLLNFAEVISFKAEKTEI